MRAELSRYYLRAQLMSQSSRVNLLSPTPKVQGIERRYPVSGVVSKLEHVHCELESLRPRSG